MTNEERLKKMSERKAAESPKENVQGLPSKMMLLIRFMLGFYLLNTAYDLGKVVIANQGKDQWFNIAEVIGLTLAGIYFAFFPVRSLKIGKYLGGALDQSVENENVKSEPKVESKAEPELETETEKETESKPDSDSDLAAESNSESEVVKEEKQETQII